MRLLKKITSIMLGTRLWIQEFNIFFEMHIIVDGGSNIASQNLKKLKNSPLISHFLQHII